MPIEIRNLSYVYYPKTPFEYKALKDINLTFEDKQFIAIIGQTGSGKSTLTQHLNALLRPCNGEVKVNDFTITAKDKIKDIKMLRKMVGMVFQFPEYQLFEETVFKDIAFGPKNFGVKEEDLKGKVIEVLKLVGLDETYLEKSPFDLSGGQKRRVAIAGLLAMDPDIIVLDEPTAGLDPRGSQKMMKLFEDIHRSGKTIIMVSHDMDSVIRYAQRVIVLQEGQVIADDTPSKIFTNKEILDKLAINQPEVIKFANELKANGFEIDALRVKDIDTLVAEIIRAKEAK